MVRPLGGLKPTVIGRLISQRWSAAPPESRIFRVAGQKLEPRRTQRTAPFLTASQVIDCGYNEPE
jgi:hypothetical protein